MYVWNMYENTQEPGNSDHIWGRQLIRYQRKTTHNIFCTDCFNDTYLLCFQKLIPYFKKY